MTMKRGDSRYYGILHSDESYEQELKGLLLKKSIKNKSKSAGQQSFDHHSNVGRRNEYIERVVLETDTLQGLALLYNSTVGEIKKLNHLYTEQELHARRIIKVPSRGILINLGEVSDDAHRFGLRRDNLENLASSSASAPSMGLPVSIAGSLTYEYPDESEINAKDEMKKYLDNKDSLLQEIREKAENDAANSPILNGSSDDLTSTTLTRRKGTTLKWWHILLPCLGFIIVFPILLFLFQEHIFEHLKNSTSSEIEHQHRDSHPIS